VFKEKGMRMVDVENRLGEPPELRLLISISSQIYLAPFLWDDMDSLSGNTRFDRKFVMNFP